MSLIHKRSNSKVNENSKKMKDRKSSIVDIKVEVQNIPKRKKHQQISQKMKNIPDKAIDAFKKLKKQIKEIKNDIRPKKLLQPIIQLNNFNFYEESIPEKIENNFFEMNASLTNSMIYFHKNIGIVEEQGQLLKLQVEKCFKKIPMKLFQHQNMIENLKNILIRKKTMKQTQNQMNKNKQKFQDYLDQINFNLNIQVEHKMKIFITFVTYLESVGSLADHSLKKLAGTRATFALIKDFIVLKSVEINSKRQMQIKRKNILEYLKKLKKMKKLQESLINQFQIKGKISINNIYHDYCTLHNILKGYCCPKQLCKYWEIDYYIARGYQDFFSKMIKGYLTEIIDLKEEKILSILQPNKQNYSTLDSTPKMLGGLDESMEVEEDFELTIKENIQKQIVSVFKEGIEKCKYSTDEIVLEIKASLNQNYNKIYDLIKNKNKNLASKTQSIYSEEEKYQLLKKLPYAKFLLIFELFNEKAKKIIYRELSILNKSITQLSFLKETEPQKHEIIIAYLLQIFQISIIFIDQKISELIRLKHKDKNCQSSRKIISLCARWEKFIKKIPNNYEDFWTQLLFGVKISDKIDDSNVSIKERMKMIKNQVCKHFLPNIIKTKFILINDLLSKFHNSVVEQELLKKLEGDSWSTIKLDPKLTSILGYIFYGPLYSKEVENSEATMLSNSIILQKNASIFFSQANQSDLLKDRQINQSKKSIFIHFQVNQQEIAIESKKFKVTSSSEYIINTLYNYLIYVDQFALDKVFEEDQEQQKRNINEDLVNNIFFLIMQFILMYIENTKRLILNSQALKLKDAKIKKSITAKHLLLCFSQFNLLHITFYYMFYQSGRFMEQEQMYQKIKKKFDQNMMRISQKFKSILDLAISQSIKKLEVNPKAKIESPLLQTKQVVNAMTKSHELLLKLSIDQSDFKNFLNINWSKNYLQKLKSQHSMVYKYIMKSTGSRKAIDIEWGDNIFWKMKELQYLTQNLKEIKDFIPGFDQIEKELQTEKRKILENK